MKNVELTPESLNDLEGIKEYLDWEYGPTKEKEILKVIMSDIKRLRKYPDTDIKLFERFGIETDYKCIYSNKNYIFYRLEGETVKIIRVLSVKRDFLYVLLGIRMNTKESEDFWDE